MESQTPNSSTEPLSGNCHCGAFKFTLKNPPPLSVRICNCSICIRNAYMWIFPIAEGNLFVEKGESSLREYGFGNKAMTHLFCSVCGSSVMAERREAKLGQAVGINARMIQNIDLEALNPSVFPGTDLPPLYAPPTFPTHPDATTLSSDLRVYNGNCHCGAVAYSVKTKPLKEQKIISCNCSLCSRNGDIWIYPPASAVVIKGGNNLTGYAFLSKESLHSFCSTCGVSVLVRVTDPKEDLMPLNVRTIDGVDLGSLVTTKYDGASNDPKYEV